MEVNRDFGLRVGPAVDRNGSPKVAQLEFTEAILSQIKSKLVSTMENLILNQFTQIAFVVSLSLSMAMENNFQMTHANTIQDTISSRIRRVEMVSGLAVMQKKEMALLVLKVVTDSLTIQMKRPRSTSLIDMKGMEI